MALKKLTLLICEDCLEGITDECCTPGCSLNGYLKRDIYSVIEKRSLITDPEMQDYRNEVMRLRMCHPQSYENAFRKLINSYSVSIKDMSTRQCQAMIGAIEIEYQLLSNNLKPGG